LVGVDDGLKRGEFFGSWLVFFGHLYFSQSLEWPKPANQRGFRKAHLAVFVTTPSSSSGLKCAWASPHI
jgi:hypothetical protein